MIRLLAITACLLALSQAATVVPTSSSSVNVKQSAKEFSYSIEQNHGATIDQKTQMPAAKLQQTFISGENSNIQKEPQHRQVNVEDKNPQQQQIQSSLSEQTQNEVNKPQEQVTIINYPAVPSESQLEPLHPNIFYILPYPLGIPQYFVRYV